jgi:hypothetical protein
MYAANALIADMSAGRMEFQAVVASVVDLLNTAKRQLDVNREAARASISRASSLLSVEIHQDERRPSRVELVSIWTFISIARFWFLI